MPVRSITPRRRRSLPALVAALLLAAGCSDDIGSIDALVQETCAGGAIDRDPATVFAAAEAFCTDGRTITWFARTEDRDAWITLAESIAEDTRTAFVILDRGRYHVVHTEDAALPLRGGRDSGASEDVAALDALLERCRDGDIDACVELYLTSPVGSDYEQEALSRISPEDLLDGPGSGTEGGSSDVTQRLAPSGVPYSGTFSLTSDDLPFDLTLVAGGSVVDDLPSGCTGTFGTRPDAVVSFRSDASSIEITATPESQGDLTLMVLTPDGRYLCDDDTRGFDPVVSIDPSVRGDYRVWVGTYEGEFTDSLLIISEAGRV